MNEADGARPAYDIRRALRHLRRSDARLAKAMERVGPFRLRLRPMTSPYAALLKAIVYQQLSGKAAGTIHGRVLALFPSERGPVPAALLALPDSSLRSAGLSRNKLLALKDLSARALAGTLPEGAALAALSDAELIERFTEVRGVGRWTVEMLLLFNLGRPDVLPVTDLGIRKGFQRVYSMHRLPALSTLERAGRAWAPYRSVASWYLWRSLDSVAP